VKRNIWLLPGIEKGRKNTVLLVLPAVTIIVVFEIVVFKV
jgi:hypothetical protein